MVWGARELFKPVWDIAKIKGLNIILPRGFQRIFYVGIAEFYAVWLRIRRGFIGFGARLFYKFAKCTESVLKYEYLL